MIFSAFMILLFPLVGLVGDQFSLNTAFILLALTGTAVYLVYQYFFRRVNREGAVLPEQEDESLKVP
jgi:hypothetical protein